MVNLWVANEALSHSPVDVDKGSSSLFITYRDEAPAMYKKHEILKLISNLQKCIYSFMGGY